ncbi:MAG: alcohol dehydrogenase catalytic domain-containing protein [Thermodesulfobacteriota bacterium]
MRAPVFTDLKTIEFREKPKPEIGPGEVLVKVELCGICGSDVHGYLNGIMIAPGTVMGHEAVGVVSEVGSGVEGFQPGDRVAVKPIAQCGACYWCRRGQYSLCPEAFVRAIGLTPAHDGAFAQYVRLKYPKEMLFKLPDEVSFEQAALIEPLATSLHAVRLSRFKPGDKVVVTGAGMIGLGVLQFLRLGGAGRIIVLEVSEAKAGLALDLGADVALDPRVEGEGLAGKVLSLCDGVGADIVFECAGVPDSFYQSVFLGKSGGQVMIVGINDRDVPFNCFMLVLREIEMKGALGYYEEFHQVIDFLAKGRLRTGPLISDIIPLAEIEDRGFKRLLDTRDLVKILVRP